MSNDIPASVPEVKLSKEEKKKRKEEKRAKKAAAAESGAVANGTDAAVTSDKKDKKEKKDKKDKKRKREAGEDKVAAVEGDEAPKEKKEKKDKDESTAASTEVVDGEQPLSKKAQKKLAKANAAASSSSSTPVVLPSAFTSEHNAYLKTHNITLLPPLYPPHLSIPTLPVPAPLLQYLTKFTSPTPIQACSWPALLGGRDVVGIAETGSGKTLAFGVPALNHLSAKPAPEVKKGKVKGNINVLVLAPTRELAQQSHENLVLAGKSMGIDSTCIFGGVPKDPQTRDLARKEVHIVVGTPGRTLDLANTGDLDLSHVSYLVLDEADRMLDQGFENDIRQIIAHCPGHDAGRQTVMFSATWPESVRRLASTFLKDPIRVTVGSDELSANKRIEQLVEVLDDGRQKDGRMLFHLKQHLKAHPSSPAAPTRILVFALYKKEAQRLEQTIRRAGYTIAGLHGDLSQDARFKALEQFKTGRVNILVATDVAARGLDIPDVSLVLNVTFPLTTEDFVHRCGRTGRAGKSGKAVTFFTGEGHERSLAGEFMRVLRDVGADIPQEMDRFPSTIKKKEHGSYGAFYKDTTNAPAPTKITFD